MRFSRLVLASLLALCALAMPASAQVVAPVPTALGNPTRASYTSTVAVTVPTAAAGLVALEADPTNKLRLRYLRVCLGPTALQTAAGERTLVLYRTTAASTGGATATPNIMDTVADAAFGGVERTSPTTTPAIGSVTLASSLQSVTMFMPAAATTAVACVEFKFDLGGLKVPNVAPGVTNGLALGDLTGGAGGTGNYIIDAQWTAESY